MSKQRYNAPPRNDPSGKMADFWAFAFKHNLETPVAIIMVILLAKGPLINRLRDAMCSIQRYLMAECSEVITDKDYPDVVEKKTQVH